MKVSAHCGIVFHPASTSALKRQTRGSTRSGREFSGKLNEWLRVIYHRKGQLGMAPMDHGEAGPKEKK